MMARRWLNTRGLLCSLFWLGCLGQALVPAHAGPPDDNDAVFEAARQHYQGNLFRAATLFERALQADPDNTYARNQLGIVRLKQGDADAARRAFERVLRTDFRNTYARRWLGVMALRSENLEEALRHLRTVVQIDSLDAEMGAIPYTTQKIGKTYSLDDQGIVQVSSAQEYGNFNLGTVSRKIQAIIDDMRAVAVASSVYNHKNQYRLYGSDGTGICLTIGADKNGLTHSYTLFKYPVNVACAVSGEDSTGKSVIFFMSDAGMVYQADKGSSFDGEAIEAYVWLPFNNSKSPAVLKSYRKAIIELTSEGYASLRFNVEFNYGDTDIQSHLTETVPLTGKGGYWDLAYWDEFYWDSKAIANPSFSLAGDGYNASLIIYSNTDLDAGHKLDGAIIHYTPRRLVR